MIYMEFAKNDLILELIWNRLTQLEKQYCTHPFQESSAYTPRPQQIQQLWEIITARLSYLQVIMDYK
jgi:hypothetical protein